MKPLLRSLETSPNSTSADEADLVIHAPEVLESVGIPVVVVDGSGVIRSWNNAAEALFGWSAHEAVGSTYESLELLDDIPEADAAVRRTLSGEPVSDEYWMRRKDRTRLYVHATLRRISAQPRDEPVAMCILADISALHTDFDRLRQLSEFMETSDAAIFESSLDGTITSWNAGAAKLFGYPETQAIGLSAEVLCPGLDGGNGDEAVREQLRAGIPVLNHEVNLVAKDGTERTVELTLLPIYDRRDELCGSTTIGRDITELARLRNAVEHERNLLKASQEMAKIGSAELALATGSHWFSEEFRRLHGLDERMAGPHPHWVESVHPDDRALLPRAKDEVIAGKDPYHFTYRVLRAGGGTRWIQGLSALRYDADGAPTHVLLTAMDITGRKADQDALEYAAYHDGLTGLANRTRLEEHLEQAISTMREDAGTLHVLFGDIDRLKGINDAMGHAAGDNILVQVAGRLREVVHGHDMVARFAGDEFVIVCQNLSDAEAKTVADRFLNTLEQPLHLQGQQIYCSMSLGIAAYTDGSTAASLLRQADAAMYEAKKAGIRCAFYDEAMQRTTRNRLLVQSQLKHAIARGEMRIYYQPIMDLRTGQPAAFEALIRWDHCHYGLMPPNTFIPIAEETGMIVPIGAWVLRESLLQLRSWRETMHGSEEWRVAVNLSACQLQHPDIITTVADAIKESGLPPAALELEITESVLMSDVDRAIATVSRLRDLGVGIALDDFGTGYSSLGYLQQFPVTTLKIDKSFVDPLDDDDVRASSILEGVIRIANALELDVVAEGVETENQLRQLKRLSPNFAQGYLWSPPLPRDDVIPWYRTICEVPGP